MVISTKQRAHVSPGRPGFVCPAEVVMNLGSDLSTDNPVDPVEVIGPPSLTPVARYNNKMLTRSPLVMRLRFDRTSLRSGSTYWFGASLYRRVPINWRY